MDIDKKKIEKHIGEQTPLSSNNQGSNSGDNPDNNQGNSDRDTSNPLKPQETQKGVNAEDIKEE